VLVTAPEPRPPVFEITTGPPALPVVPPVDPVGSLHSPFTH
jgi:hypothetical protein